MSLAMLAMRAARDMHHTPTFHRPKLLLRVYTVRLLAYATFATTVGGSLCVSSSDTRQVR